MLSVLLLPLSLCGLLSVVIVVVGAVAGALVAVPLWLVFVLPELVPCLLISSASVLQATAMRMMLRLPLPNLWRCLLPLALLPLPCRRGPSRRRVSRADTARIMRVADTAHESCMGDAGCIVHFVEFHGWVPVARYCCTVCVDV